MRYRIEYSPEVVDHLRALSSRQQALVLGRVEKLLTHEPTKETRSRKLMRPNPIAPWELRIQNLRVYYDVEHDPEQVVHVLAVGMKKRNQVWIGDEMMKL